MRRGGIRRRRRLTFIYFSLAISIERAYSKKAGLDRMIVALKKAFLFALDNRAGVSHGVSRPRLPERL